MKILLDECVPKPLKREFTGHDISTVAEMGWSSLDDGDVLSKAADAGFTVFITTDQNLPYQQNISRMNIGVVVLIALKNRLEYLTPLVPRVFVVLSSISAGEVVNIQ